MIAGEDDDLRCRTPNGHEWRVEIAKIPRSDLGRQRRIRVVEAAEKEREVPLVLDVSSRLLYGWLGTWPPERASRLYCEGDAVVIVYRDEWIPFEPPVLPFGYDRESEWMARFNPVSCKWNLKRLQRLGYDREIPR
ncbi:MAG: hypothetical protein ABSG18_17285 [Steroidobacteraceae bacterium]|jgi:hypothetical protein